MPDVFTKTKRSEVMSRIRGHGNKDTELALLRLFRAHRITGWRRRQPVFGKPDFVFPKLKLAVFVDGCFWHGCPQHATQPRNNAAFWRKKFAANQVRDRLVTPPCAGPAGACCASGNTSWHGRMKAACCAGWGGPAAKTRWFRPKPSNCSPCRWGNPPCRCGIRLSPAAGPVPQGRASIPVPAVGKGR